MLVTLALILFVMFLFWLNNFYSGVEIFIFLFLFTFYMAGWIQLG